MTQSTPPAIGDGTPAVRELPLRPCVGIMLVNRDNKIWIGRRLPKWVGDRSAFIWQMPQGGIGKTEEPLPAAIRELYEETNVSSVELIAEHPEWLSYELPVELRGVALKGKYRGQRQRWFAFRFTGPDSEIDISAGNGHKAEFDEWRWEEPENLIGLAISFKRDIYRDVVRGFAPHLGQ